MVNDSFMEESPSVTQQIADDFFSDTSSVTTNPNDVETIILKKEEKKPSEEVKPSVKKETPSLETKDAPEIIEDVVEHLFGEQSKKEGEGEEEDVEEIKPSKKEEKEEEDVPNQFEIYSQNLYKLGIFTPEQDERGNEVIQTAKTPEEFKELFEYQGQLKASSIIENFLSRFGEDRRELFDAIFSKGVDPKEYLPVFNKIQDFEGLDLVEEKNQERVIREFYRRANLADDKIEKKIQRLKDIAELQTEAEDLHPQILSQDKKKLEDQETAKQNEIAQETRNDTEYKTSISRILTDKIKDREFDGIPIDEKKAQKAFDFLYSKKYKTPEGKKLTEFDRFILELNRIENHSLKVKLGLLAMDNLDLSKIQKKALSKESGELFSGLAHKKIKQTTNTKKEPVNDNWGL